MSAKNGRAIDIHPAQMLAHSPPLQRPIRTPYASTHTSTGNASHGSTAAAITTL